MGTKEEFNSEVTQACQTRNTLQGLLARLPQAEDEERLILEKSLGPALVSYQHQVRRLKEMQETEASALTVREVNRREREVGILATDLALIENGLKTKQVEMQQIASPQELLALERLEDAVHGVLQASQTTYQVLRDDNRYLTQIHNRLEWETTELHSLTKRAQSLTEATSEKCLGYVIIGLVILLVLQLILL